MKAAETSSDQKSAKFSPSPIVGASLFFPKELSIPRWGAFDRLNFRFALFEKVLRSLCSSFRKPIRTGAPGVRPVDKMRKRRPTQNP